MKDGNFMNRGFVTISAIIFLVSILAMPQWGVCSSSVDDETAQQQLNETEAPGSEELRLREDAEVKEVNEATSAEIAQAEAVKRNRCQEELGYVPTGKLLSDDELASFENQRAEKEKDIRAKVGYEIKAVEQESPAMESGISTSVQRADVRTRRSVTKPTSGFVTGIVYYNQKGAALLDGEVVWENDTVMGITVAKISPDYVEFEKQGKKWKQLVGQTPPAIWSQLPSLLKKSTVDSNSKSKPAPKTKAGK